MASLVSFLATPLGYTIVGAIVGGIFTIIGQIIYTHYTDKQTESSTSASASDTRANDITSSLNTVVNNYDKLVDQNQKLSTRLATVDDNNISLFFIVQNLKQCCEDKGGHVDLETQRVISNYSSRLKKDSRNLL